MTTVVVEKLIRLNVEASQQAQQSLRALQAQMDAVDGSTRRMQRSLDTGFAGVASSIRNITALLGAFGVATSFVDITKSIVDMADSYKVLQSRLKLLTGDQEVANKLSREVVDISTRTGAAIDGTAKLYEKATRVAQTYGRSQADAAAITEGFSNSLRLSGASTQEASAALIQFGQALASGRLQGDEFRSLAENNSFFINEFAKAIGVSIAQLKEMGSEGKLNTELLFNTMLTKGQDGLTLLERINKQAEQVPLTISQNITALGSAFTGLVGELTNFLNKSSGVESLFKTLITRIKETRDALAQANKEADIEGKGFFSRLTQTFDLLSKYDPSPFASSLKAIRNAIGGGGPSEQELLSGGRFEELLAKKQSEQTKLLEKQDRLVTALSKEKPGLMQSWLNRELDAVEKKLKAINPQIEKYRNEALKSIYGSDASVPAAVTAPQPGMEPKAPKAKPDSQLQNYLESIDKEIALLNDKGEKSKFAWDKYAASLSSGSLKVAENEAKLKERTEERVKVLDAMQREADREKQVVEAREDTLKRMEKLAEQSARIAGNNPRSIVDREILEATRKREMNDLIANEATRRLFDENNSIEDQEVLSKLVEKLSKVGDSVEKVDDLVERTFEKNFVAAVRGAADAVTDFVLGTEKNFSQVLRSIAEQIVRAQIRDAFIQMTEPLSKEGAATNALKSFADTAVEQFKKIADSQAFKSLASSLAGLFGGTKAASTTPYGTYANGGYFNDAEYRANGGMIQANSKYNIAETGDPEIVRMQNGRSFLVTGSKGGMVYPAGRSSGGGGGEGGNVYVSVENNSSGTARVEESTGSDGSKQIRVIIDAAVDEVSNQLMNGGKVASAGVAAFGWSRASQTTRRR